MHLKTPGAASLVVAISSRNYFLCKYVTLCPSAHDERLSHATDSLTEGKHQLSFYSSSLQVSAWWKKIVSTWSCSQVTISWFLETHVTAQFFKMNFFFRFKYSLVLALVGFGSRLRSSEQVTGHFANAVDSHLKCQCPNVPKQSPLLYNL